MLSGLYNILCTPRVHIYIIDTTQSYRIEYIPFKDFKVPMAAKAP